MTVPIIPGPFSFLGTAGRALGTFQGAKTANARRQLDDLMRGVQIGFIPKEVLATQEARDLFAAAGIELPAGLAPALTVQEQQAQEVGRLTGPRREAALGIPSEAAVAATEAGAAAERARAETTTLARTGITPAQARAAEQIPGVGAAVAGEAAAAATAAAATATAAATQAAAETQTLVSGEISKRMADDPSFARWSAIAAQGFLGLYTARIASTSQLSLLERQRLSDRFRLLFEPFDNAPRVFNDRLDNWRRLRQELSLQGASEEEITQWEGQNPRPTIESVQTELIAASAMRVHGRDLTFTGDPVKDSESVSIAINRYFEELDKVTGAATTATISPERRQALESVARSVVDGAVSMQDALQRISATAESGDAAAVESVELQLIINQLRGQPDVERR